MTEHAKQETDMPDSTKMVDVTDVRHTTPVLLSSLNCMFGHSFRVVLKGKEPIALECTRGCATTWTINAA